MKLFLLIIITYSMILTSCTNGFQEQKKELKIRIRNFNSSINKVSILLGSGCNRKMKFDTVISISSSFLQDTICTYPYTQSKDCQYFLVVRTDKFGAETNIEECHKQLWEIRLTPDSRVQMFNVKLKDFVSGGTDHILIR
ncbi:MAG: hypothetical protein V4642_02975 [Bacteroidota bacterium]